MTTILERGPEMARELRRHRCAALYLTSFVFGVSAWMTTVHIAGDREMLRSVPPFIAGIDLNANDHLGGEYYNIAVAISEGRGFSDPFALGTGPTAWMPPVYSSLLAALTVLAQERDAVALIVLVFKNLTLIVVGLAVYASGPRPTRVPRWIRLAIYSVWLLVFARWFFMLTHDCWLIAGLITALYLSAVRLERTAPDRGRSLAWGGLGGLTALTQPVLALVWLVLTGLLAARPERRKILWALIPFAVFTSIWVARNQLTFNRLILVKSNLSFDFHQANVDPGTGVLSEHSFVDHPINQDRKGEYARLGEAAFVERYHSAIRNKLNTEPGDYVKRVRNRALAATLVYVPYFRWFEASGLALRRLVYPLPFLALVILLTLTGLRLGAEMRTAVLIYSVYLLPYVLVTFYIRYAIPLVLLQSLFMVWAVDSIAGVLNRRLSPAPAEK
jgi:hypothetical protein